MWGAWLIGGALLAAPPQPSPEPPQPWPALLGSGLLTLQDTATLAPGHFTLLFTVDNRDRDPLGLDIVDGAVSWTVGVTRWAEFYGHHIFGREVAVPDTPVLPPPPLDVIVAPGTAAPQRPYYSLYSPLPYVDDSGPIRFGAKVPGEGTVGLKVRTGQPKGWRSGLAWSAEVKFPLTQSLTDLQGGSGTGGLDVTLRAVAEWRRGAWSFVASPAFTRVGSPAYPDQRIELSNGGIVATEEPLVLPYRLDVGVGVRRALGARLAAVAETTTVFEVGRRTPALDPARPVDALGGLQLRWGGLRATAALRYHGNDLPSMAIRPAPLSGLVDVTHVRRDDLLAWLSAVGMADASPYLREGAHRLLVPPPGAPPLPPGSRVIPPSYRIRSEGQVGFVLTCGWSF